MTWLTILALVVIGIVWLLAVVGLALHLIGRLPKPQQETELQRQQRELAERMQELKRTTRKVLEPTIQKAIREMNALMRR